MSATYGHNISGSEAFNAERFGARLASSRPRQRIEVEPAKADNVMLWIAIGAVLFTVAWTVTGGAA